MLHPIPFKKALLTALIACFLPCFFLKNSLAAPSIAVNSIQFNNKNNLEISIDKKVDFKAFRLTKPDRLVVDIFGAHLAQKSKTPQLPSFISKFRHANSNGVLRLVFDFKTLFSLDGSSFSQLQNESKGTISAEISGVTHTKEEPEKIEKFIFSKLEDFDKTPDGINYNFNSIALADAPSLDKAPIKKSTWKPKTTTKKIIVIDSGHGGKDPGTIGVFARTKEKNITLSYAKELGKQLIKTGRYKVYLTRSTDIFIPLKGRVAIARRKKADMFISLHANATSKHDINGFSIYTLSETSSDKLAEKLARKENRAGIIHGVNFDGASPDITKTLIDLSQRESMNGSARFAKIAINSISKSDINILQNTHRFAGFAVLTAPDMISVLIELGYLSNKYEERLLNSVSYKRKVAKSLVKAIDEYFVKNKN